MTVNDSANTAASPATGRRAANRSPIVNERIVIGAGTVLGFRAAWELTAGSGAVDPLFISSPTRVVKAGAELFATGEIWKDIEASAAAFFWGYLLSIVVAVPLGLGIGLSRRIY